MIKGASRHELVKSSRVFKFILFFSDLCHKIFSNCLLLLAFLRFCWIMQLSSDVPVVRHARIICQIQTFLVSQFKMTSVAEWGCVTIVFVLNWGYMIIQLAGNYSAKSVEKIFYLCMWTNTRKWRDSSSTHSVCVRGTNKKCTTAAACSRAHLTLSLPAKRLACKWSWIN